MIESRGWALQCPAPLTTRWSEHQVASRESITAGQVRTLLHYDPDTGVFTWQPRPVTTPHQKAWNSRRAGKPAGNPTGHGYWQIRIGGHSYYAHRLAWLYVHGVWPPEDIDHINDNGLDNRLANLRLATTGQNLANARLRSDSTTGYKGVSYHRASGLYHARIHKDHREISLGYHSTAEEAATAYQEAAERLHGEFARTAE